MKSTVLMFGDPTAWDDQSDEERQQEMARHHAFAAAVAGRAGCRLHAGEALSDASVATTVRRDAAGAPVLTDGPFAESTEQLGGFYVVETPDFDVLVELLTELPASYTLEIRPVWDPPE